MARNENPPFARGETWFGVGGTTDSTEAEHLEGKEWVFEDVDPNDGTSFRTGHYVRCRCVRNASGVSLLPKLLAQLDTTAGEYGGQVIGYANTTAGEGYPIDEYLPAAGVADDDLFWIVIEGPAVVTTTKAGNDDNVINLGSWVVAATAAASTSSTTAGRVEVQVLTGSTAPLANQIQNRIGVAMSAKTTANTDADLLVEVKRW